jgi:hypothetical protein
LQRRLLLQFVAELAAGEFLYRDLASALRGHDFGKLPDAPTGWMVGVVQVPEADRPFLNVLCLNERRGYEQCEAACQFEESRCH